MKIKNIVFIFLTAGCTFFASHHLQAVPAGKAPAGGAPFGGGAAPFNPNMSEEEMLAKLMEEIDAAIPEDQRKAFWAEVEAETRRLEEATAHMTDEEKQAYLINQMNAAMEEAAPLPEQPVPVEEKKEEKPKPKPAPVKEAVETSEILKSIVKSINSFLNKAAAFPDFDRKVDRWAKQNLLSDWPANQTWEQFKNELNKFSSLLQRFQEKDAKIGMKHIDALAKNEQAVQMLKQLETKLSREVPIIDVSVFTITSMSKKTKNAIAHTMNALTEALYKIKLKDTLQKIIEEFDPAAKKLREEEEKAAKEALSKTQRPTSTIPVKTAGKAERKGDFFLPSLDDAGIGAYGAPYSGGSAGSRGVDDYSGYEPAGGQAGGRSGGSGKTAAGKAPDGKADAAADKGKAEDKKGADKKGAATETITAIKNPEVKEHVDNFRKNYSEANSLLLPLKDKL